jgi:high affinity Mn2+ porin
MRKLASIVLCSGFFLTIGAQSPSSAGTPQSDADSSGTPSVVTMFPHTTKSRFFAAGQTNIIFQANPPFHSPYEGPNSFVGRGEYKTSLVGTLYLGAQLRRSPRSSTDLIVHFESSGGRGLSQALGLAGFTNLDVVRNPTLGSKPYLARVQIHQVIGLSTKTVEHDRDQFSLSTELPERRLEFRVGKMSLPDTFDTNLVGSDSHLQFTNWTIDNNGAWDYAADTRGYTWGAIAEYDSAPFSLRYGVATMPTVANGIDVDYALRRASGQNIEAEWHAPIFGITGTTIRALSFINHANMGTYRVANRIALAAGTTPDVTATRQQGTVKYGFGLNLQQELPAGFRAYSRFGWNEGQHESFAYTEVDQSISVGVDHNFASWGRPNDRLGVAFVSNAIKRDHQHYLELGGLGFILGDGRLNYAREDTTEFYYNAHAWRGLFFAMGGSVVVHPGYNQDRGPILVPSVRTHFDF